MITIVITVTMSKRDATSFISGLLASWDGVGSPTLFRGEAICWNIEISFYAPANHAIGYHFQ
jgi:hypothetical protein